MQKTSGGAVRWGTPVYRLYHKSLLQISGQVSSVEKTKRSRGLKNFAQTIVTNAFHMTCHSVYSQHKTPDMFPLLNASEYHFKWRTM